MIVVVSILTENKKDKMKLQKIKHSYMVMPRDMEIIDSLYRSYWSIREAKKFSTIKSNPEMIEKLEQANGLIDEVIDWFFKEEILPTYKIEDEDGTYNVYVPHQIAPWSRG